MNEEAKEGKLRDLIIKTQIIEKLITLLEKYNMTVKQCFKGDTYFERQRFSAFE